MKKIFITGGAGYVGCRLVKDLLEKNFFVTVYDAMHYTDQYLPKINKVFPPVTDPLLGVVAS